ncbi:C40 family peptidase [Actinoplanes sichuanensis]|uniref:C40 family peptidase n=1 Tax=Actinoplanes sichuanensis TaxID=512349 RepID=A0ABW4AVW8_9ACTN|nr:C40 family peptidase [Actinoplanes sichuanensis]
MSTFGRHTRSLGAGSIALSVGLGLLTGGLGTPQAVSAAPPQPVSAAPQPVSAAPQPSIGTVTATDVAIEKEAAGDLVVTEAARHRGAPYRYGAVGPDRFDCSGFTMYVYRKTAGRKLPHKAHLQQRYGTAVGKADAHPGDLIIIRRGSYGTHAGIYAGDGTMWSAPRTGKTVTRQKIWSSNYVVRRLV